MNRADFALVGIATVASLLILIPLGVGLADAQISNSTLTITNSTGTFEVPAFTNSTGTFLMSEWVEPVPEPEPFVEPPVFEEPEPAPVLPTGTLSVQKYTPPTFPDEYYMHDDLFKQLAKRTTIGSNYDLVEDYRTGQAIWTSTIDKIQDGFTQREDGTGIPTFKNYVLQQSGQKVIFNSNSVGGLVYDLPTCSYSIKENGYNGQTVVPSVSAVATGLVNGEWTNLQVNDALCNVNVSSDADGIVITSTKSVQLDPITVVNSFNGTSTQVPQSETFTQVLEVDSKSGIKETWKVWKTDDTPLGISQTVHTGAQIEIAGQVIDIEALNGQSFDRQYIVDNQAEILAITDSVNYDFDDGIDSLTGVNILYDSDYKVNLDYASGDFIGYLEIDPTFTALRDSGRQIGDTTSGTDCGTGNWEINPNTGSNIKLWRTGDAGIHDCMMQAHQWDVSSLSAHTPITVSYEIEVTSVNSPRTCEVNPITDFSASTANLFTDIQSGTPYASGLTECQSIGTHTIALNSDALTDLTSALSGTGLFSLGWAYEDMTTTSTEMYTYANLPNLIVTYQIPAVYADPPTSLTATDGLPIGLTWTAPTFFGSDTDGNTYSSLTGYSVARTQSSNSLVELPDNSGTNANLDFTNNEFLIHGFEDTSAVPLVVDDNFSSSTDWTLGQMSISNNKLSGTVASSGAMTYLDLTSTDISDDKWNMRFGLKITGTSTSSLNALFIGLADSASINSAVFGDGDHLGTIVYTSDPEKYNLRAVDGGSSVDFVRSTSTPVTNTQYYVEVIKDGANSSVRFYDSSDFTDSGSSLPLLQGSNAGSVNAFDYFMVKPYNTGSGSHTIEITDLKVYSGITDTTTQVTTTTLSDKSTNSMFSSPPDSRVFNTVSQSQYNDASALCDGCGHGALVASTINSGSALDGMQVAEYSAWLYTGGGTPNGVITASIGENTGATANEGLTTCTIGTIDTSTITLTSTPTKFTFSGNTCTIDESAGTDWIGLTTTSTVWIGVKKQNTDVYDSTNTQFVEGNFNYVIANDMAFELKDVVSGSIIGSSTTGVIGTGLQNPDISFTDSNLPDNTDDFSVGSWVKLDTQTDNIVIDWNGQGDNNDHFAKVDLGSALSDTNWVLRFTNEITAISATGGSGGNWMVIGLGDSPSIPATNTGQDFIGVLVRDDGGSANGDDISSMDSDGSTDVIYDGRDTFSTLYASSLSTGTYNTEIIRTSATAYTVNHYNSDWSSVIDTISGTTNSNNDGLRYFTVDTSQDLSTGSPAFTGQVTNVQVWDGVTSATGTPESFDSLGTPLGSRVTFGTGNALATEPIGELLKLNDVTFNVGSDSASVSNLVDTNPIVNDDFSSYTTQAEADAVWETPYSRTSVDIGSDIIDVDFGQTYSGGSNNLPYLSGTECATCMTLSDSLDTDDTFKLRWKVSNVAVTHPPNWLFEWAMGLSESKNWGTSQDAVGIKYRASVSGCSGAGSGWYTFHADNTNALTCNSSPTDSSVSMGSYWIEIERTSPTDGTIKLFSTSDYTATPAQTYTVDFTGITNLNYINFGEWDYSGNGGGVRMDIDDVWLESSNGITVNSIISATGLTDNTSTPQHYTFTRSANDWTIYQNGASEATATDSTSLGSNTGQDYTTNIDGMIDEYFINSDALTATEVNNVSTRGVDAWSILPNPNDYPLVQTDLPNNSVNESGSTGEEIDFTDNEFLLHGFETNGNLEDKSTNSISVPLPTTSADVEWRTDGVDAQAIGNTVQATDTSSAGSWGYVTSTTSLERGNYVEYTCDVDSVSGGNTNTYVKFGFHDSDQNTAINTADFDAYCSNNTSLKYWESGSELQTNGVTWSNSDIMKLEITDSGTVKHYMNDVLQYTFPTTAGTQPYYITATVYGASGNGLSKAVDVTVYGLPPSTTSTTGVIGTGVQSPDLSFTDSNLPDNTDDFSVGSWVKLDMGSATSTFNAGTTDVGFNTNMKGFGNKIQSGNDLIGKTITGLGFYFKGTTSATLTLGVFDTTSSTPSCTMGTVSGSTLTSSYQLYEVTNNSGCTVSTDQLLGFYTSGDISNLNVQRYNSGTGAEPTQFAMYHALSSGNNWQNAGDHQDTNMAVSYIVEPTNTKLLGLNDVTFNVGTTSASVVESSVNSPSYTSTSGYSWTGSTDQANWSTYAIDQDQTTFAVGVTHHGQSGTLTGNHIYDTGNTNSKTIEYNIGVICASAACANLITPQQNAYIDVSSGDLSSWTVNGAHTHLDVRDVETMYTGSFTTSDRYIKVSTDGNCGARGGSFSYTTACEVGFRTNVYEVQIVDSNTIISATGLSDNTSTPQHYTFTRSANDWEIYQNGAQVGSTVTDTTSLGAGFIAGSSGNMETTATYQYSSMTGSQTITNGSYEISAQKIANSNSELVGKTIGRIDVPMALASGTGTVTAGVFDSSGNTLHTFGTRDITTISTSTNPYNWYSFTGTSGYTLSVGEYVGVKIGSSGTLYIPHRDSGSQYDGSNSHWDRWNGSWSSSFTNLDQNIKLYVGNPPVADQYFDYTTHIDGMIDEYFINSDVLTASEISKIDRRGETASPVTTTSTSFNDNTVVAGNEYFYKVYSVTPDGYGTASNIDGAMTVSPANAPTGLSASVNSNAHIVLDWTPSTDLGNGSLISMNIQRDDGSGWQTIATTSNTSPPYTDTSVVTSTTYDYRVASVNEAGVGAYSNTVTATAGIPADAITNVVATIPDPNNQPHDVEISFSEPANWGTGTAQTYDIYESLTGTGGWTLVASPSYQSGQFTTTVTISNVQPATEYFYKVLAVSNHGVSNDSNVDSVITADVPSQPDPAIIGIDDPDNAPLDITVNFVDPFDGGSAIKGWMIERHDSTTNVWSTIVANTANTNLVYHDTSVLAGTDYKYRVSAINPIGTSIASLESNVVTTPTVPSAPLSLTATTIDDASIELNWSQPTSNGGSVIQTFSIQNDASGTFTQVGTVNGGVTTFTHSGLSDGTNYNYQVVAVNNVGTSVPSNQANAWTLPSAPANLVANAISSGDTLELEWDQPTGTVTEYRVQRALMGATNWSTSQTVSFATACSGAVCTVQDTGLSSGTEFQFRIVAVNLGGDSDYSNIASNWTVPSPPSNLTVSTAPNTSTTATLNWSAPSGTVTGYQIERESPIGGGWSVLVVDTGSTLTTYDDVNLPLSTEFNYRVSAMNLGGISLPSNEADVTTLSAPTAPTGLTLTLQNPYKIQIDWTGSGNLFGGTLQGYKIERNVDGAGWTTAIANTASTSTTVVDGGLSAGVDYSYRVSAITQIGTSAPSASQTGNFAIGTFTMAVTPIGGNTIQFTPTLDITEGLPNAVATKIWLYNGDPTYSTPIALHPQSASITTGTPYTFPIFYEYPTTPQTYTARVWVTQDDSITMFTSPDYPVTPLTPFSDNIMGIEERNEVAVGTDNAYTMSEFEFLAQPAGYNLVLKYQHIDPTNEPKFYAFENVQTTVNSTVTGLENNNDYYISAYLNPDEFDYNVVDPATNEVDIVCNENSPSTCPEGTPVDDIPKGVASEFVIRSHKAPTSQPQLGIEPMGDLFGIPMIFLFVIGLGAIFTGRNAQMGILIMAVTIGVMTALGYIDFNNPDTELDENLPIWGIMVVITILGMFVGKRF